MKKLARHVLLTHTRKILAALAGFTLLIAWPIGRNAFHIFAAYPPWFLNYLLGGRDCNRGGGYCATLMVPTQSFKDIMGMQPSYKCNNLQRWGAAHDGGWNICVDDDVQGPKQGLPCVVYSFGGRLDWSFELSVVGKGCEVYTFDPTVSVLPADTPDDMVDVLCANVSHACGRNPDPRIHFMGIGLHGADLEVPGLGPVKRLSTFMQQLGHESIDLLKVDIEASEWPWFLTLSKEDMARVKQFVLEIHFTPKRFVPQMQMIPTEARYRWWGRTDVADSDAYQFYVSALNALTSTYGFNLAHVDHNMQGSIEMVGPWPAICYHEMTYVRTS